MWRSRAGQSRTGRLLVALAVFVLVTVGVVIVVGEVWVRPEAEKQIANGIVDELGLTGVPDVKVRGFPLVLHAMRQKLDGIEVTAKGEVFGGLRVDTVELRIDDVTFATGDLLRRSGTVRISGGEGTARITDDDLSAYLASIGLDATVELDSGEVRVSGPVTVGDTSGEVATSGTLGLTDDTLTFAPTSVDLGAFAAMIDVPHVEAVAREHFAFQAPVPDLNGVQLVSVRVGEGEAAIQATFDALDVAY